MSKVLRRTTFAMLFLLFLLSVISSLPAEEGPFNELDAYIQKSMEDWQVPGLAIALVKDNKIVFMKGYGLREIGKKHLIDENTIFAIGSTSKAFTSAAIGLLVQEKKLSWDDPVTKHLPDFQMYDPWVTREISIRDLLCNRGGLGVESEFLWYATDLDRDEIVRRLRYVKPDSSFRSHYAYRNAMFLTAGQIIPAVTGMSWDAFIKERIFKPLGMSRSNTSVRDLQGLDNVATPHFKIDGKVVPITYRNIDNIGPAGSINASIKDMAQWLRFQLAQGVHDGKRITDAAVIEETHKPHIPVPMTSAIRKRLPMTQRIDYCLGWVTFDYREYLVVWHTGSTDGMQAAIGFLPDTNLGAVILTNYESHNLDEALFLRAIERLLNLPTRDWSTLYRKAWQEKEDLLAQSLKALEEARVKGTTPSLPLAAYAGTYENDLYGKVKVTLEDDHLVLHLSSALVGDLKHWNFDTFYATWRDQVANVRGASHLVTFTLDAWGKVSEMRRDVGEDPLSPKEITFIRV